MTERLIFRQKLRQLLLHLRQRISAVADGVLLVGSQLGIAAASELGRLSALPTPHSSGMKSGS